MTSNSDQATPTVEPSTALPSDASPKPEQEAPNAQETKSAAALVDETIDEGKAALRRLGEAVMKPVAGAAVAGTLVVAAAVIWGAAEAAVGAGGAYLVYRLLRTRQKAEQPH